MCTHDYRTVLLNYFIDIDVLSIKLWEDVYEYRIC